MEIAGIQIQREVRPLSCTKRLPKTTETLDGDNSSGLKTHVPHGVLYYETRLHQPKFSAQILYSSDVD
jgi:hypothetical protein